MVSPVGTFFIVLVVLLVVAAVGWIVFTQLRARRLGLPAPPLSSYNPFARSEPSPYEPQPAPSGIGAWISDKLRSLRSSGGNKRSAAGAYEQPGRHGRNFGPLDPDEAWDTRVGNEADAYGPSGYYEEQELGGMHHNARDRDVERGVGGTAYEGGGYDVNLAATTPRGYGGEDRGRTMSRSPGVGGGGLNVPGGGAGGRGGHNPFDDDAEPSNISLRGVSPRPIDTGVGGRTGGAPVVGDSPTSTSERRSVFRENV